MNIISMLNTWCCPACRRAAPRRVALIVLCRTLWPVLPPPVHHSSVSVDIWITVINDHQEKLCVPYHTHTTHTHTHTENASVYVVKYVRQ